MVKLIFDEIGEVLFGLACKNLFCQVTIIRALVILIFALSMTSASSEDIGNLN